MELSSLQEIPDSPGVYIFRNEKKKPLYVGKAVNLKNRVKSYFQNKDLLTTKTRVLVEKAESVDFIKVETELEALLLESDLIKRYRPPYNISLKDDKFYKYISVDYTKINGVNIYKVGTTRKKSNKGYASYFGPYPEGSSVNLILKTLRKIFPYRDCNNQKFNRYKKAGRPCLYGHIGLCPAPCQGEEQIEINNNNVKKIREYLKGDRKRLFQKLEKKMKEYAKTEEYEKAATLRDQIAGYEYLMQEKRNIREYIETPTLVDDADKQGLQELVSILKKAANFKFSKIDASNISNFRIEVYDISNIQGKNAVGSMVVLSGGSSDKKEYRRFKIKIKDTPDDFLMMQEILKRRFSRDKKSLWKYPDLIVIDGGKGQLSSSLEVFKSLDINIPAVGLAKREEEIVIHQDNEFIVLKLPQDSAALNVIKRGRDESHRFAINYYRKLHRKNIYN